MARLADRLRDRIRRGGPLPFRAWMDAALYDPDGGFYAGRRHPAGVGRGTHFATSPTLHPFFAQAVAKELADAWAAAGSPPAWEVVEFGAGTGALARDAMRELDRRGVPARWSAVDVQPGQPIKGGRWVAAPPERYDAAVANEFLDALAFDVAEWSEAEAAWRELGVGLAADGRSFAWAPLGPAEWAAAGPPADEDGQRRVRMPATAPWLAQVAEAGAKAAAIVDYGQFGPSRDVRAFEGHAFADPLAEPGTVDLTADVDFQELGELAAGHGFTATVESQERFLLRHGVLEALNRIDRTTREGASDYLRLRQLLLPTGFGTAFKVAVLRRA